MKTGPKPRPLAERFATKYAVDTGGHWLWTGALSNSGYGKILAEGERPQKLIGAHVASFLVHKGPIPADMEIDHLCRVKLCVNPEHLEAVTPQENMRRVAEARKACRRGHPYVSGSFILNREPGGGFARRCKRCRSDRAEERRLATAVTAGVVASLINGTGLPLSSENPRPV